MDTEPGDSMYTSTLDEASRKKAKEELFELNDTDRAIAVQTFRKWVNEQDWLTSPTDFGFLLRFIRARKFSQLGARQTLENFWACRSRVPEWFRAVDPADESIQAILRTGFYLCPKKRDKKGRRVIMFRLGCIDSICKEFGVNKMYKAAWLVYDWVMCDENCQVNGINLIGDYSNLKYMTFLQIWTPAMASNGMKYITKALPTRIKVVNIYHTPTFFDAIYALAFHLMSEKIRNRFVLHGQSLVNIYDDAGMEVLPKEYLPDDYTGPSVGTIADVAEEMIADMNSPEFKTYIKELSNDKYGVDFSKRKLDTSTEEASFRKISLE